MRRFSPFPPSSLPSSLPSFTLHSLCFPFRCPIFPLSFPPLSPLPPPPLPSLFPLLPPVFPAYFAFFIPSTFPFFLPLSLLPLPSCPPCFLSFPPFFPPLSSFFPPCLPIFFTFIPVFLHVFRLMISGHLGGTFAVEQIWGNPFYTCIVVQNVFFCSQHPASSVLLDTVWDVSEQQMCQMSFPFPKKKNVSKNDNPPKKIRVIILTRFEPFLGRFSEKKR